MELHETFVAVDAPANRTSKVVGLLALGEGESVAVLALRRVGQQRSFPTEAARPELLGVVEKVNIVVYRNPVVDRWLVVEDCGTNSRRNMRKHHHHHHFRRTFCSIELQESVHVFKI